MTQATQTRPATLDDLMRVEGRAELLDGRIVHYMSSGYSPSRVGFRIAMSLDRHATTIGIGIALPDGVGYALNPPLPHNRRQSFQPDASYYTGPLPSNPMRFIEGTPTFAVEVRSENDYGPAAEREMEAKRADHLAAGTLAVWDVDPVAKTVAIHRHDAATPDAVYRAGEVAEAEPAVPGWRLAVDDIFG